MFVCGDSYLMLAKCQENLTVHQEDYHFKSEEDVFISEAADDCISGQEGHSSSVKFVCDLEQNMLKRWESCAVVFDSFSRLCICHRVRISCTVCTPLNLVIDCRLKAGGLILLLLTDFFMSELISKKKRNQRRTEKSNLLLCTDAFFAAQDTHPSVGTFLR